MKVSLVFLIFGFCGIALADHSSYSSRHDASQHDRYRHSARNRALLVVDDDTPVNIGNDPFPRIVTMDDHFNKRFGPRYHVHQHRDYIPYTYY